MIKQLQNLNTGSDAENIKLETVDLENIHEMNEIFQNIIKNEEDRKLEKDYDDKQETGVTIRIEDFEEKELLENDINESVTVTSSTAHHHIISLYSSRTSARSN